MRHPRAVLAGCGVAFLLLCLFCIVGHAGAMATSHAPHVAPPATVASPPPPPEVPPRAPVLQRALDAELRQGTLEFATGKALLGPAARPVLARLATLLQQSPEAKVEIVGHTDDVGTVARNQALSEARAEAVKAYLVEQGVSADRLSVRGEGESNPAGDNSTAAGRQRNRRIDFRVR